MCTAPVWRFRRARALACENCVCVCVCVCLCVCVYVYVYVSSRAPACAGVQAYTVADTAGVVEVWECGPGCAVRLAAPAGGRAWATHTNHVLGPSERARGAAAGESVGRLATVDAALARGEAPEAALGAAVKRGGGGADAAAGVTFAAFVARAPGARVAFCDGARMRAARPESPLPLDAWDTVTFEGP